MAAVTLEDTVRQILRESGADRRGQVPRGSLAGRVDVIGWNTSGNPKLLVEVKKPKARGALDADADRMRRLKNRSGSSITTGLIAAYLVRKSPDGSTSAATIEKLVETLNGMATASNTSVSKKSIHKPQNSEGWIWCAAVLKV